MAPADAFNNYRHLGIGNMRAIPGQEEVHLMNRSQGNMNSAASYLFTAAELMIENYQQRNSHARQEHTFK